MQRTRLFIGGFAIACILIVAFIGFLLVDMSTDRYMPGVFEPLFLISSAGEEGVDIAFMGESYLISTDDIRETQEQIWQYRGFLPGSIRVAGALAVQLYDFVTGLFG